MSYILPTGISSKRSIHVASQLNLGLAMLVALALHCSPSVWCGEEKIPNHSNDPIADKEAELPPEGDLITGVLSGGLVQKANMKAGDIVYTFGGVPVVAPGAFTSLWLGQVCYIRDKDDRLLENSPPPKEEADGSVLVVFRRGFGGPLMTVRMTPEKKSRGLGMHGLVFRDSYGKEAHSAFLAAEKGDFEGVAANIDAAVKKVGKQHPELLHIYALYLAQIGKLESAKRTIAAAADRDEELMGGCGRGPMVSWGRLISEGKTIVKDPRASRELGGFIIERHIQMYPNDAHIPAHYARFLAFNWRDARAAIDVVQKFLARGTEDMDRETMVRAYEAMAEGYKLLGDFEHEAMGFHQEAWECFLEIFEQQQKSEPYGAANSGINAIQAALHGRLWDQLDDSTIVSRMNALCTGPSTASYFSDELHEYAARVLMARNRDKKDIDESIRLLNKLEGCYAEGGWPAKLWTVRYLQSRALRLAGKEEEASKLLHEQLAVAEAARDAQSDTVLRGSLGADERDAVFDAVADALRTNRADMAFELTERFRSRLLADLLIEAGIGERKPSEEASKERAAAEEDWKQADREFEALLHAKRFSSLLPTTDLLLVRCGKAYRRLEAAQALLAVERFRAPSSKAQVPEMKPTSGLSDSVEGLAGAQFTVAEARALARELECAFVCYYVGPQCSYAFVITSQTTMAVPLTPTESDLARLVWVVRAGIQDANPQKHKKAAQYVYDLIWKPVEPLLKGVSRVGIVPHASLHSFPFAVLHDGENYLCNKHALFFAPSVRALKRIVALKQREVKKGVRFLALGNPDQPDGGAGFLKASEKECEDLSKGFYVSSVLLGAKATESAVKKLPEDVGFLHLSCHGMLSEGGPLESALLLARTGPDDTEDGYLRAREILKLDLKRLRFMALSACVTGLGRRSSGDDVLGLTCACFVAGAPTTAASLWPVGDESTYLLFKELYNGVGPKWINLTNKLGYDEAMRQAQIARMLADLEPLLLTPQRLEDSRRPILPFSRWKIAGDGKAGGSASPQVNHQTHSPTTQGRGGPREARPPCGPMAPLDPRLEVALGDHDPPSVAGAGWAHWLRVTVASTLRTIKTRS